MSQFFLDFAERLTILHTGHVQLMRQLWAQQA